MSVQIRRSDLYPVGTTVSAYAENAGDRRREAKPAGSAVATAVVDANGMLAFPTLAPGRFTLHAEVGGKPVILGAGGESPPPAFMPLQQRIAARRREAHVG